MEGKCCLKSRTGAVSEVDGESACWERIFLVSHKETPNQIKQKLVRLFFLIKKFFFLNGVP